MRSNKTNSMRFRDIWLKLCAEISSKIMESRALRKSVSTCWPIWGWKGPFYLSKPLIERMVRLRGRCLRWNLFASMMMMYPSWIVNNPTMILSSKKNRLLSKLKLNVSSKSSKIVRKVSKLPNYPWTPQWTQPLRRILSWKIKNQKSKCHHPKWWWQSKAQWLHPSRKTTPAHSYLKTRCVNLSIWI